MHYQTTLIILLNSCMVLELAFFKICVCVYFDTELITILICTKLKGEEVPFELEKEKIVRNVSHYNDERNEQDCRACCNSDKSLLYVKESISSNTLHY